MPILTIVRASTGLLLLFLAACGDAGERPADAASTSGLALANGSIAGEYDLAPSSRFDVHTETAGLLGELGHEHLVRAAAFEGRIRWDPENPASSSVRLVVLLDSLRVLTGAGPDDIREIRVAMEDEVLEVGRYPELTFVSDAVAPTEAGVRVTGHLTLHGATRREVVYVTLDAAGDTLRAVGSFSVRQTDYGIEPYRAAAGTIAVADEIVFDFEAIGVPAEEGSE